jgi:hypothetical protein
MKIIISDTAVANGYGCDRWKVVSFMSEAERKEAREGTALIIVTGCRPHMGNGRGDTFRKVVWRAGRAWHKVVRDAGERAAVLAALSGAITGLGAPESNSQISSSI